MEAGYTPYTTVKGTALYRVQVAGKMTHKSMLAACKAKGMKPVCSHKNWGASARCLKTKHGGHLSEMHGKGLKGACFYVKFWAAGYEALCNTGSHHQWSHQYSASTNGFTMCAKPPKPVAKTTVDGKVIHRVKVTGKMSHQSMAAACAKKKMKPVCDASHWGTGPGCVKLGISGHLSTKRGAKLKGTCFYVKFWAPGYVALCNTGGNHM